MSGDCVFCKIANGALPAHKVYETDQVFAFLDLRPVNQGHVLVIPKTHCETLVDLPSSLSGPLLQAVQTVGKGILRAMGVSGFNVVLNNGKVAGQVVFHVHFHVIPRTGGDGLSFHPSGKTFSEEQMKKIAEMISKAL